MVKIDDELLNECKNMALRIAPELRQQPLYFVRRLPEWPVWQGAIAWAAKFRDVVVEDYLRKSNQWRGNGNVVVFDIEGIERAHVDDGLSGGMLGLVVHEVGHLLPLRKFTDMEAPAPHIVERAAELHHQLASEPLPSGLPPWCGGHDYQFVRRVIHLSCRAWELGYEFLAAYLAAGEQYGMSPIAHYAYQLRDEPYQMLGASFAEIEASPLPDAFMQIWRKDREAWEKEQEKTQQSAAVATDAA